MGKVEKLEGEYTELAGQVEVRTQELSKLTARLEELPGLLVEAEGKGYTDLAAEFGQAKAQAELKGAELRYLQAKAAAARLAIFRKREELAQGELITYMEGPYLEATEKRKETERAVRAAQNGRGRLDPELVGLRVAKEEAAANLALVVAPKLEELRRIRDQAQAERQEVEEEIGGG